MAAGVALLGSTGSIGRSTLAVLERHAADFRVIALAAHRNGRSLGAQVHKFRPQLAVLVDDQATGFADLAGVRLAHGRGGLIEAATHPDVDIVVNAVVGAAGLEASLAALDAGKRLALANKESLVAGGALVMEALRRGSGELVPVDSEHSAILQCLTGSARSAVRRIVLTASGGPFREFSAQAMSSVTPAEALQHPTWAMGAKITVDSATLANKALEVIEGHFLFGLPYDSIDVVVHPQSIVHSMVEFVDGSVVAQMGFPSMELPILYALTHPARLADESTGRFDPVAAGPLTFEPVDTVRFPAFRLGVEAGRIGGTTPAVFNAANEVAVAAFLAGRLPFGRLAAVIEAVLDGHEAVQVDSLETVQRVDRQAREEAERAVRKREC